MADPCTKFEVSSVSRCGDFTWGVNSKMGYLTLTTPLPGKIFIGRAGLAVVSQCTKLEVSRFTRCEAMNGGAKCRKWGGLGWLGHWQCHHSIERTAHDFLFDFNRNHASILYRFRDIA